MASEHQPSKIGQGHAQAMGRLGLKELAQALPAFPTGPIQPVEEPGLFGNPVPQEIYAQKQGIELESTFNSGPQANIEPQRDMEKNFELAIDMEIDQ